jgi:nucleoside-diphosphate kinase
MTTNQTHPRFERTLAIIKPDGVQRSLVGEILRRFENVGLKVVGMKMLVPDPTHIEKHYTLDPAWKENVGKKSIEAYKKQGKHQFSEDPLVVADTILGRLKSYMTSGPVVAFVLQGAHAVGVTRKLVGGTEPLSSDVGTIRGDYVHDSYTMSDMDDRSIRNVIHASGSPSEAEAEIAHWFKEGEIIDYRLIQEVILYDVNVDGKFE